jgi:hypothetical protein
VDILGLFKKIPFSCILALSLNPGKFYNSVDILVLVKNDLDYIGKIGLTSRYCGLVGNSETADHLPIPTILQQSRYREHIKTSTLMKRLA